MAVSTFGVTAVGGGLTDQGGTVVLSQFKTGDVAISYADLASGSYYLTIIGQGTLQISYYGNGSVNAPFKTITANGSTTVLVALDASYDGLAFTGSYDGPLVFQTITAASTATLGSATYAVTANYVDFSTSHWRTIENSSLWWGYTGTNIVTFYDMDTKVGTTSPAVFGRANGGNIGVGTSPSWMIARNPNTGTLIFANGYGQGGNSLIRRSTDGGATWSNVTTITANAYGYWDSAQYEGSNFYITAGWTGQNQGLTYYYVSSNDGLTWTLRNAAGANSNEGFRKIVYSQQLNKYFGFSLLHPSQSQSPPYTEHYWDLGADGTGVPTVLSNYPPSEAWVNVAELPPAENGDPGKLVMVTQNGYVKTSSDGINWVFHPNSNSLGYTWMYRYGNEQFSNSRVYYGPSSYNRLYFSRRDGNSYKYWMVIADGSSTFISTAGFFGSPFSAGQSPAYGGQLSREPGTNAQRMSLMAYNVASRYVKDVSATIYSQSGISAAFGNGTSKWGFYSPTWDTTFIQADDSKLYRSEVGGDPLPSILVSGSAVNRAKMVETTSGALIYADTGSTGVFRSTNGGLNWTFQSLAGINGGMTNMLATYNGTVVVTDNSSTNLWVSTDDGQNYFKVSISFTGNGSDRAYLGSNALGFIMRATNTGKTYFSTNGIDWIEQPSASSTSSFNTAGDAVFSIISGTSTGYVVLPNLTNWLSYTTPTSSYTWMVNKLGSGYIMQSINSSTYISYFYTSDNGLSWTQRVLLNNKRWGFGMGSDTFALVASNNDGDISKIESSKSISIG